MQSSLLNSTLEDKNLSEIPNFKYVILSFIMPSKSCFTFYRISLSFGVPIDVYFVPRLLLKQLITMEVIQWTTLWDTYKNDFENEKASGESLGEKAAEDLKQRIIEHVNTKELMPLYLFSSHKFCWLVLCDMLYFCTSFCEH